MKKVVGIEEGAVFDERLAMYVSVESLNCTPKASITVC